MKQHTLFDEFDYRGYWWVPSRPDRPIAGNLVREGGKTALRLLDNFGPNPWAPRNGTFPRIDVLHGALERGEQCTIIGATETGRSIGSYSFVPTELACDLLFIGFHAESKEPVFEEITARFGNLEEWVGKYPLSSRLHPSDGISVRAEGKYESFPAHRIAIPSIEAELSLEPFFSSTSQLNGLHWRHAAGIRLRFPQGRRLAEYLPAFSILRNLLTLLMGEATSPVSFQGAVRKATQEGQHRVDAEILFGRSGDGPANPLSPFEMLVPYEAVKGRLESIVNRWFEAAGRLRTVLDLYFATVYNPGQFLRFQFLNLAQAIEIFARLRAGDEKGNKPFKPLMADLLAGLHQETERLLVPDRASFIDTLVDTRDYFTHFLCKHEERSLDGADLFHFNQRLRALLTVLLLREAGLGEEEAVRLILANRQIMHWLHAFSEQTEADVGSPAPQEDWWGYMQRTRKSLEEAGASFLDDEHLGRHIEWLREGDVIDELLQGADAPARHEE